jgi:tetratricopeptide (TPR) repeat protein/tRNA A-37 threonylcarbamoyl transferase component Bud32
LSDTLARLNQALQSRYALERELGSGGMATVYLAEDVKHHRKVAVKVLRPDLAATLGPARFLREIEIAAQLQHPHILPLLDSGEAEGLLYYVMPYIEGESLRDRLARQRELPVAEAVRLLRDVADALSYAHGRGVVHRDIKPDNVMLSGRHALVADFGVAKAVSEATGRQTMTTAGVALGTPAYMAPEQAAADPHVDHRADLYALGAMGYELLTGQPPFSGLTPQQVLAAHVTEAPKPVAALRPACPPALAEAIMRCLAKRPADRWQSAEELLEQLELLGTPSAGTTPTSTMPTRAVAPEDRWYGHPLRVGGLFSLAAVAVLGAVYFLTIQLGLPDWVPWGALALLGAGLPIMLATGLIERRRARLRATGVYSSSGETGIQRLVTWRRAIQGGMVAFSVLGVGTLAYTAMRLLGIGPVGTLVAAGRLSERDRVIVAEFDNRTTDSMLGASVTEAFRIDLAQSPVITVLSSSQVGDALGRMGREPTSRIDSRLARELATRENGKAYVAGEISRVGQGYVLTARLHSTTDGAELVALREDASDDAGILRAIDRLSARLRERIGESLRTIRAGEPLDRVTTGSLEALRLYSDAVRQSDLGAWERAVPLLEQAVGLDTGFAMAYRKLAVAYSHTGAGYSRQADAATRAFRHRGRLPELERYQAEAYYYWVVDYDLDKVIAAYRGVLAIDPNESTALNNLAVALNQRRQWAESEQLALRAIAVDTAPVFFLNAIHAQLAQGKSREAWATLDAMAGALPDSPDLLEFRALLQAGAGDYDSATATFLSLSRQPDLSSQVRGRGGLVSVAQLHGKISDAERGREALTPLLRQQGDPAASLAMAAQLATADAFFRNRQAAASRRLDLALEQTPLARLDPLDRPYPDLVLGYAMAGQPGRARRLWEEYQTSVPAPVRKGDFSTGVAATRLALAEGRARDAIQEARSWRANFGCPKCGYFEEGQAFDLLNQPDSAITAYEAAVTGPRGLRQVGGDSWNLPPAAKRLGELYEGKGNRDKALEYYGRFVDLWRDADPELQPAVQEVKQRMARLAGEGGR